MSADWGLVRFKKTSNVYWCCYEGTSDILNPFICTSEECRDETGCHCAITYCRELAKGRDWTLPDVDDMDEVEIYSDYGGGFYWPGTGSESAKMIDKYLDPFAQCYDEMIDGRPEWADEFWLKHISDKLPQHWIWRDERDEDD